jgi:hypothetical protein
LQEAHVEKRKEHYRDMAMMALFLKKALSVKGQLGVDDLVKFEDEKPCDNANPGDTKLQSMLKDWRARKAESIKWLDDAREKQERGEVRQIEV